MNRRTALKAILTIPAVVAMPVLATPVPAICIPLDKYGTKLKHIDVTKFGATADGVTDDSGAFRLCLILAHIYKLPIHIPNGTYRILNSTLVKA